MTVRDEKPAPLATPREHWERAAQLLAETEGADMGLPFVRHKVARAAVHAQLAQGCPYDVDEVYDAQLYRNENVLTPNSRYL